jgi:uncharacterized protein YndB with AHSA1/START domain
MADIIHRIGIHASPSQVYPALSTIAGLAGWWTEETQGDAKVGGRIDFVFRTPKGELKGKMTMEVQALKSQKAVGWRCVDGPPEWIGTLITFELKEEDGQTIVSFAHRHWPEGAEVESFMSHCSMKWAVFLLSLRDWAETGKGKPSPHDLKIDNWN